MTRFPLALALGPTAALPALPSDDGVSAANGEAKEDHKDQHDRAEQRRGQANGFLIAELDTPFAFFKPGKLR